MAKQKVHLGVESADKGFGRFIDAWEKAEQGTAKAQVHINFEDFSQLMTVVTPKRLEILKVLRQQGNMSIRALSKALDRDYKNVHTDAKALEEVGLIDRTPEDNLLSAPFDVIDAHLSLVA